VVSLLASASEASRGTHRAAIRTPRRRSEVARQSDREDGLAGLPGLDLDPQCSILRPRRAAEQDREEVGGSGSGLGRSPCREARRSAPVENSTTDLIEALEMPGTRLDHKRDGSDLAGRLDARHEADGVV
jgi:hypothetical protein